MPTRTSSYDILLHRAAEVVEASGRSAIRLSDLARRLDAEGDLTCSIPTLRRRLDGDTRFRLVPVVPALPGVEHWAPKDRAAYRPVFVAAGQSDDVFVLVVEPPREGGGQRRVGALLTRTVRLLAGRSGADLQPILMETERAHAALSDHV